MRQRSYTSNNRSAGLNRACVRLLVYRLCTALLLLSVVMNAEGSGKMDRPSGWYSAGTNLTATANPDDYEQFDYWTGHTNGTAISGNQISFNVSGPRSLTAVMKDAVTGTNAVPYRWLAGVNPDWTNELEAVASEDFDGDGYTTGQEYWSGTDPTDPDSVLKISGIEIVTNQVRLTWAHARVDKGKIPPICIEWRASMSTGSWMKAGAKLPADGTNTWDDFVQPMGYYRLSVTNMP